MAKFIIQGGKPLSGKVKIDGMKNAAVAILTATLLTLEECVIDNVPRITDVENLLKILQSLGATVAWSGEHQVKIKCEQLNPQALDQKLVCKIRSSILFFGPLLGRLGKVKLAEPGGCIIGNRPLDTHLYGLQKLGASVKQEDGCYVLGAEHLIGSTIILPEFSVTATENILMAAVLAEGITIVKLAAAEPHVQDLCHFLVKMGAKIEGIGTHTLQINGVNKLHGAEHALIPDQIEIGTFAVAAAATRGEILIENIAPEHLEIILLKLEEAGVNCGLEDGGLRIRPSAGLRSFKLQTLPYPGFPTDLQAPFAVLATQCNGTSLIQDPMFEGRMGYAQELVKMGANAIVADPHRVVITGPTPLYGREIKSLDLRAGATLVIAGLVAEGETVINEAEVIDRGYERLDEKLKALGADIKRI